MNKNDIPPTNFLDSKNFINLWTMKMATGS